MGTDNTNKGKASNLLAETLGLTAAIGGPYTMQDMGEFYSGKPQRVVAVLKCHVCGAKNVTLYKDGENRICRKCRERE